MHQTTTMEWYKRAIRERNGFQVMLKTSCMNHTLPFLCILGQCLMGPNLQSQDEYTQIPSVAKHSSETKSCKSSTKLGKQYISLDIPHPSSIVLQLDEQNENRTNVGETLTGIYLSGVGRIPFTTPRTQIQIKFKISCQKQ